MITDVFHDLLIARCARCQAVDIFHNATVNSFGVRLRECALPESDDRMRARMRARIIKDGQKVYARMQCGGQVVRVENHDAAVAAFRLGGHAGLLGVLAGAA